MTTLLDRLAAHGVEIPTAVTDAVAMEKAAGQHIQRPIDAATILTDAYNRGELTPQNLEERLMAAAEREWFQHAEARQPDLAAGEDDSTTHRVNRRVVVRVALRRHHRPDRHAV